MPRSGGPAGIGGGGGGGWLTIEGEGPTRPPLAPPLLVVDMGGAEPRMDPPPGMAYLSAFRVAGGLPKMELVV